MKTKNVRTDYLLSSEPCGRLSRLRTSNGGRRLAQITRAASVRSGWE